ncbi:N-acetylmuramoyl-L-alanine amidase [Verrucomicrobiota bacterium]
MTKNTMPYSIIIFLLTVSHCVSGNISPAPSVPLKEIISRYSLKPVFKNKTITLKNMNATLTFENNSRKLFFEGILVWLNSPMTKHNELWSITNHDMNRTIEPLLKPRSIASRPDISTIVIDPGHGGNDPGAIGHRKVYEKKVTLDIAKRISKKLNSSGLNVKLTRTNDSALSRAERVTRTKRWRGNLFISIHINWASNKDASGMETYILPGYGFPSTSGHPYNGKPCSGNKYDAANMALAYYVHKGMLVHSKADDRGIKRARFDVLKNASCPAILVECGFVSNQKEEAKLIDGKYRDSIAEGITQGILTYVSKTTEHPISNKESPISK